MNLLTLTIAFLAVTVSAYYSNYEGYKVFRIQPIDNDQLSLLSTIQSHEDLDFWTPLRHDGHPVDIMVSPVAQRWFVNLLLRNYIQFQILINNVKQTLMGERTRQLFTRKITKGEISFSKYHRHDEINAYLEELGQKYPDLVQLETIGQSYEGRDLIVVKISTKPDANKPVIFMDAGIHAREWIAPPVALYTINQLVENASNVELLDKVDWHILPVVNPDGYEFTHSDSRNRLWRKTRKPGAQCDGVDGNRNWDFHWAEIGSSNRECDETFHGPHPFSEPETLAVSEYILRNKKRIKLYLTIHSYGNMLLYPWAYTYDLPDDHEELQALGESVAKNIKGVSGTNYVVGSVTHVLMPGAGGSDDWAKGGAGIELSYTIELPGGGSWGFDPPPSKIWPVVAETWEGMKTFNNYIAKKFNSKLSIVN